MTAAASEASAASVTAVAGAAGVTSAASAYAGALLRQVDRLLRLVPGAELGAPALAAIDRFLAAPRADTFVGAVRVLNVARTEHATERLRGFHDGRLFRRGLEAVRALPGVGAAHAQVLAELPADGRTGQRLVALAQLLEAHAELSGRTAAAFRELRRKLGPTTPAKPAAPPTWRTPVPGRRA